MQVLHGIVLSILVVKLGRKLTLKRYILTRDEIASCTRSFSCCAIFCGFHLRRLDTFWIIEIEERMIMLDTSDALQR